MTPDLEERLVVALERVGVGLETMLEAITKMVEQADEERTKTMSAREVQRIPPAPSAPRVPRPRAQL